MAEAEKPRPRIPTANALFDGLVNAATELDAIRGVCERAYELSRDPKIPPREMWISGEFPFALGTVMARTWGALDRLEQVFGIVPELDDEKRIRRGRELVEEYRRQLHADFGELGGDARKALAFIRNRADESLARVPAINHDAELALRDIADKARELIGDE